MLNSDAHHSLLNENELRICCLEIPNLSVPGETRGQTGMSVPLRISRSRITEERGTDHSVTSSVDGNASVSILQAYVPGPGLKPHNVLHHRGN